MVVSEKAIHTFFFITLDCSKTEFEQSPFMHMHTRMSSVIRFNSRAMVHKMNSYWCTNINYWPIYQIA